MNLTTLKSEFHPAFPRLASGKYIHFIMLRHSQSFPVFQTDGVLNAPLSNHEFGITPTENTPATAGESQAMGAGRSLRFQC